MKKFSKYLLSISSILALLIICSLTCVAAAPECKLTVILEDNEKNAIDGLEVSISKIADFDGTDYSPASGFEDSGISISAIVESPSADKANNILEFVKENDVASLGCVSESGKGEFTGLDTGIWLVYCDEEGEHSFNPYIVFLPYVANGQYNYEISSAPKTQVNTPDDKSIYVLKKWDDNNNSAKKRPDEITIELKRNKKVVDTAILNEGNGWAYTFSDLSDQGKYSVSEKAVENYSVKYSGDSENGFIITNTYNADKLPQTGQLWWPIAVISVVGILFVLLGIIELGAGKNDKKNK